MFNPLDRKFQDAVTQATCDNIRRQIKKSGMSDEDIAKKAGFLCIPISPISTNK